jgi:hypothetical protein
MQWQHLIALRCAELALPLPATRAALRQHGLASEALGIEARRARERGVYPPMAGVELVEISGICASTQAQVRGNLAALRDSGVDRLVLSWDLWRMPLGRLEWL